MAFSNNINDFDDYNEDDLEYYDEAFDAADREERKIQRQGRIRVAAGVMDFLGVIGGMIVALIMVALLVSLVNWLHADIFRTITILQTRL